MTYDEFMADTERRWVENAATLRGMGLPDQLPCRRCGEPILIKGGHRFSDGYYADCQKPGCEDAGPGRPTREEAVRAYMAGEKPEQLGDVIVLLSPCES